MQAFLLALELCAIVWVGIFICGKWVVEKNEFGLDLKITASVR